MREALDVLQPCLVGGQQFQRAFRAVFRARSPGDGRGVGVGGANDADGAHHERDLADRLHEDERTPRPRAPSMTREVVCASSLA